MIIKLLENIQELSIKNGKSLEQIGLKLSEETGECSQALLSYVNAEGSVYKGLGSQDVKEECRSEERRVGKECRSRWSPYH